MTSDPSRPDVRRAGEAARDLRRAQHLGHPADVPIEIVARRAGLLVVESAFEGARALTMRTSQRGIAVVRTGQEPGPLRFDKAHELAHFLLHALISHLPLCLDPDADPALYKKSPSEREADVFAREFLMPRAFVLAMFGGAAPNWDTILAMAKELIVSMIAAALRLVELSDKPMALVRSTGNAIDWAKRNFLFGKRVAGQIVGGRELHAESVAHQAPEGLFSPTREVPLDLWLPGTAVEGSIVEQSFGVPDGALTLLELRTSGNR